MLSLLRKKDSITDEEYWDGTRIALTGMILIGTVIVLGLIVTSG